MLKSFKGEYIILNYLQFLYNTSRKIYSSIFFETILCSVNTILLQDIYVLLLRLHIKYILCSSKYDKVSIFVSILVISLKRNSNIFKDNFFSLISRSSQFNFNSGKFLTNVRVLFTDYHSFPLGS